MTKDPGQGSIIEDKDFPHSNVKFWPLSSKRNLDLFVCLFLIHLFLEDLKEGTDTKLCT